MTFIENHPFISFVGIVCTGILITTGSGAAYVYLDSQTSSEQNTIQTQQNDSNGQKDQFRLRNYDNFGYLEGTIISIDDPNKRFTLESPRFKSVISPDSITRYYRRKQVDSFDLQGISALITLSASYSEISLSNAQISAKSITKILPGAKPDNSSGIELNKQMYKPVFNQATVFATITAYNMDSKSIEIIVPGGVRRSIKLADDVNYFETQQIQFNQILVRQNAAIIGTYDAQSRFYPRHVVVSDVDETR